MSETDKQETHDINAKMQGSVKHETAVTSQQVWQNAILTFIQSGLSIPTAASMADEVLNNFNRRFG